MPLPLPNLDDRTYAELVEDAQGMIHGLCPEWTDYNPSDPGIMLVELLAWLTEMTMYRINRVTDANYDAFLKLLNGKERDTEKDLQTAIRNTVNELRQPYRAVTAAEFEVLTTQYWPESDSYQKLDVVKRQELGEVKRAHCLPEFKATQKGECEPAKGNVLLIVVPSKATDGKKRFEPSKDLCDAIKHWLDDRRLLGVQHHVVGPQYVEFNITAQLILQSAAAENVVKRTAVDRVETFFHPLRGGPDGDGWPLGRDVYVSEVYELLDGIPGVDYVDEVMLDGKDKSYEVKPHQLVLVEFEEMNPKLARRVD